jgi:hypothetical protein
MPQAARIAAPTEIDQSSNPAERELAAASPSQNSYRAGTEEAARGAWPGALNCRVRLNTNKARTINTITMTITSGLFLRRR